jgi:hypothetical protein
VVCAGEDGYDMDDATCAIKCMMVSTDGFPGPNSSTDDTVQCRLFQLEVASGLTGADKKTFCDAARLEGSPYCTVSPPPIGCDPYCQAIQGLCGDLKGPGKKPAAQYNGYDACFGQCQSTYAFPKGEIWHRDQNTIGCRYWHAVAAGVEDPLFHCPAAGPSGGGVCGSQCELYCQLATTICTDANALYDSVDACLATCSIFPTDGKMGDLSGDTLQCRLTTLASATDEPAAPAVLCPQVGDEPAQGCVGPIEEPNCADYCALMDQSCPGSFDGGVCLLTCNGLGFESGSFADEAVNTLGCRMYHGATNMYGFGGCVAAYISGGDVCGAYCETYCDLALSLCTGPNQLFNSLDTCDLTCAFYPSDGGPYDYGGDSVQCRINHFAGAISNPVVHCPHAGSNGGGECE